MTESQFLEALEPAGGGCLFWTRAHNRGYGRVRFKGRVRSAHRVAWWIARGQKPPDHHIILHTCGRKACCNPDHLRLSTFREIAAQ